MRKKRSKILEAVHATARGLHAAGAIDRAALRKFSSADIHAAVFPEGTPEDKASGDVKDGIRRYIRRRRTPSP